MSSISFPYIRPGNEDDWSITVINLNYEPYKVSPENGQNKNDEQNGL